VKLKDYIEKGYESGFSYISLNGKVPNQKGWQSRPRESLREALEYADQGNVGLRCGAVSAPPGKYLVVIDQDGETPINLPPTVTVQTGRGWHKYYYADQPIGNSSGKLGPHIDVRGKGGQVVYPGSIHPDRGMLYDWVPGMSPNEIAIADLPDHITRKLLNGDKPKPAPLPIPQTNGTSMRYALAALEYECANVRNAPEGSRNDTLNTAAFKLGTFIASGHLTRDDAEQGLLAAAHAVGLVRREAEATIKSGLDSGMKHPRELSKVKMDDNVIEYPEPMRIAEHYLNHRWQNQTGYSFRRYQGNFYCYDGICYQIMTDESLDTDLYPHLDQLWTYVYERGERVMDANTGKPKLRKIGATSKVAHEIRKALPALEILIDDKKEAPLWFPNQKGPDSKQLLVCQNGILDLSSCVLHPCTPEYFALNCLAFPYDPNARPSEEWLRFLSSLWPDDKDAIQTLQEWFGYCLTVDTSQQKMLLLVGPKRSGKGTIGRILTALIGENNISAPTLGSLTSNFGLQPLLGKQLAIISDARLSGRADQPIVVERLLAISGEDGITVDRKNKSQLTVKLPVRFMIMTNELPKLNDASGALASRFIVLTLRNSFYGKEDTKLSKRPVKPTLFFSLRSLMLCS